MDVYSCIKETIQSHKEEFEKISDSIWNLAETRFKEYKSAELLCKMLEMEGFTVKRKVGDIDTAFIAYYGDKGPTIGFLGEYDALPNMSQKSNTADKKPESGMINGHGCGHHALGTGAMAAAIALKNYIIKNNINASIRFYGCPAEEGGAGKAYLARAGLFNGLDIALTWHPGYKNELETYSTLANVQEYFKFYGVSSHAAIAPHLGRSALDAAELMNVGVNFLREHIIPEARIHYAITDAGGDAPNIVQSTSSLVYLVRAPHISQVKEILSRVEDIASGAALMTQTRVETVFDKATCNLIPNKTLLDILYSTMKNHPAIVVDKKDIEFAQKIHKTFAPEQKAYCEHEMRLDNDICAGSRYISGSGTFYYTNEKCEMNSTDVGDVSWIVPTATFSYTCMAYGTMEHSWQFVAQGKSPLFHKGMLAAAEILAISAAELIEKPELIKNAKKELKERLGIKQYECPIPPNIKPSAQR